MRNRTTYLLLTVLVVLAGVFGFTLGAQAKQEVCPEEGKVESQVDGDLNDIVLDYGTVVCIKGGQTIVTLTSDGYLTLFEMLNTGHDVSHYTVLELPPPPCCVTTTTTTPSTTTTVPDTTTTTDPGTTTTSTTLPSTTTTTPATSTTVPDSTTTTVPDTSSTTVPSDTTTTTGGATSITPPDTDTPTPTELPYTGPVAITGLALLGALLIGAGVTLIRRTA